jgi:4-hydroxy-tetrahydrodipicolinate synthase
MTDNTPMRGVFAPVLTPFRQDLSPDTGRFVSFCRSLLDEGCHGLVLFGTTSEANSLALEEREALTEAVIEAGIPPAKLMVGTGLCALPETVRLTRHAVELGCGGTLMLPPFYYKGMSDAGLYRAFAEVIERVGDARLRVYLYHFPKVSNVPLSLDLIERLVTDYGETVVGIKDSSGDWQNTSAMLERFPGFGVYPGNEVLMLAALRGDSPGCITATANIGARLIRRLYDAWETADADELQARVTAVRQAAQSQPLIPGLKRVLARRMDDDGWLNLRPPFVGLDDVDAGALFAALREAGFDLPLG